MIPTINKPMRVTRQTASDDAHKLSDDDHKLYDAHWV